MVSRLEARLEALEKLQSDVMQNNELEPWLKKHDLAGLSRLWQKIHIEMGWEVALESVLRERLSALEIPSLDAVGLLATDTPPARLALYQKPSALPLLEEKRVLNPY